MKNRKVSVVLVVALGLAVGWAENAGAEAVGRAITYQALLVDSNTAADGEYDFQFRLYDSASEGTQLGSTLEEADVEVIDGQFAVKLDFADVDAFNGEARWLEISVRPGDVSDPGAFVVLSPRQEMTPVPYALALPGMRTEETASSPNVIGGATSNTVNAGKTGATIGGGQGNTAGESNATVGGGENNSADGYGCTVGGGGDNIATGMSSTVPGGFGNTASGIGSFAAGRNAKAIHGGSFVWADGAGWLPSGAFGSTGDNQFLIRAAGGVGINTSNPDGYALKIKQAYSGSGYGWLLENAAGNKSLQAWVGTGGAVIDAEGSTDLQFQTGGINRLFIDNGGNVGIGTTSPGSYKLAVSGTAAKTGGGSWSVFSDIRLKTLAGDYEHGLSEVSKLTPVRYSYRENNELELSTEKGFVGLVAQEVQEVIPEAVEENDKGYLLVNNDPIIWAMVNAIKELKTENEELKQRLEALESTKEQRPFSAVKEVQQ